MHASQGSFKLLWCVSKHYSIDKYGNSVLKWHKKKHWRCHKHQKYKLFGHPNSVFLFLDSRWVCDWWKWISWMPIIFTQSFMEYQTGYENDRNKGYCWMFISGVHQGCSPWCWCMNNPPDPKISTQSGGGIPGFLLLTPSPSRKVMSIPRKQFIPMSSTLAVLTIKLQ